PPRHKTPNLGKIIRPPAHSLLAGDFLYLLDSSKLAQRRRARFVRRHVGGNVSVDQKIDMLPDFFRHFRVAAFFAKHANQSTEPGPKLRRHTCQAPDRTRSIPLVMRDQSSSSAANSLRTTAVSL